MMKKLFYGGDILTMTDKAHMVEAIYIEEGKILKVGDLKTIRESLKHEVNIQEIDLQGKTLMPSFIDTHSHISMVAQMASMADLSECESIEEIIKVLKGYKDTKNLKDTEPIIGFGYDHNFLKEGKHPTKEWLNQVSLTNPIFVLHTSAHMGCANDKALEAAGISSMTPNPEGGIIGRIEGTKEPSGYLEEAGMMLIQAVIYKDVAMDSAKMIAHAQQLYMRHGITTVQDGAASSETVALFKKLAEEEALKIDVVALPLMNYGPREIMKNNPEIANQYYKRFKLGGYKMLLDGSPQGKTAWMSQPYEGEESYRGYPWLKDEEVKTYISWALQDNQQLLVHCNGDAAADQLLDLYEEALGEFTDPVKQTLRPVMIHCQTTREDQFERMARLKMIPSMFVAHTYYWGDIHLKNLGTKRGHKISAVKSALDKGLCVNFHQDAPVVKPSMLHTVWCAVNRITRKGIIIGSDERIEVYDALKAVTCHAAYQYFEEDKKGTIEEGKLADLVILDKNPLKVDKINIKEIKVLETIKEGVTVYREV